MLRYNTALNAHTKDELIFRLQTHCNKKNRKKRETTMSKTAKITLQEENFASKFQVDILKIILS